MNTNIYEYAINKYSYPRDIALQSLDIWSPIKWPVHYHNSLNISFTLINSISLIAERCYPAFTNLYTSANVLKQERMVIVVSINMFFPYCSNKFQLNKFSPKLASYSYSTDSMQRCTHMRVIRHHSPSTQTQWSMSFDGLKLEFELKRKRKPQLSS